MSLNTNQYFTKLPRREFAVINDTAAPGVNVVSNNGTDPSRVISLALLGDSSDRTIEVYHHNGSTYKMIYTGTLPANAGRGANNPALELVSEGRVAGVEDVGEGGKVKFVYDLPNGHSIRIRTTATPSVDVSSITLVKDFSA